jgi:hypothetical protein
MLFAVDARRGSPNIGPCRPNVITAPKAYTFPLVVPFALSMAYAAPTTLFLIRVSINVDFVVFIIELNVVNNDFAGADNGFK